MARTKSLTQEALLQLGPEKLAKLILDEAGHNTAFRRIVTAALASTRGPEAIAAVIDRRLSALERARAFIDWDKRKALLPQRLLPLLLLDGYGLIDRVVQSLIPLLPPAVLTHFDAELSAAVRAIPLGRDERQNWQQQYRRECLIR